MSPIEKARAALGAARIAAPTDAQVTRCIALAAWYAATGPEVDAFKSAAADVVAETGLLPEEK